MPIIGFSISKIEGFRDEKITRYNELKINSSPRIIDIVETYVKDFPQKILSVKFEFETKYTPKIGNIVLTGRILLTHPNPEKVLELWKKENRLEEKDSIEIFNYLFRRCTIKSMMLAEELQLPPPLPLPKIKVKEKK